MPLEKGNSSWDHHIKLNSREVTSKNLAQPKFSSPARCLPKYLCIDPSLSLLHLKKSLVEESLGIKRKRKEIPFSFFLISHLFALPIERQVKQRFPFKRKKKETQTEYKRIEFKKDKKHAVSPSVYSILPKSKSLV
jgi:hypothetical protein